MQIFNITPNQLLQIVNANQNRTIDQQIQLLRQISTNPTAILLKQLKTNIKLGINTNPVELQQRRKTFGTNKKEQLQAPSFLQLFCESLDDFTLKVLMAASFASIIIQVSTAEPVSRSTAWIEGFAIFMAVIISSFVTTVNNYQKQRQFLKLNQVADSRKKLSVIRDGQTIQIHQDDILVGDLVILVQGMQIPADGYLVQSNQLTLDQSAMTGQTEAVQKQIYQKCQIKSKQILNLKTEDKILRYEIPSPIILSGTRILTGSGLMIVIIVGESSCLGRLRALAIQKDTDQTPLQQKLTGVSKQISKFGLFAAIFIVAVLLLRFAIIKAITRQWNNSIDIITILNYFILGIIIIVVAIPQGLPLSVSLSLAFSVKKMLEDQNLVRKISSCQTMGGANMICSDKTGTLTTNKMTLVQYFNHKRVEFEYNKQKLNIQQYFKGDFSQLFIQSICLNSSATLRPQQKGSSTQIGMLKLVQKFGINYNEYRNNKKILVKIPFNSKRKRMSVVIEHNQQKIIFIKGAAQILFSNCNRIYNINNNKIQYLTQNIIKQVQNSIQQMASRTLRPICLAYKLLSFNQQIKNKDQLGIYQTEKSQLIFLCILGIKDVPRQQVEEALKKCRIAGIRVRMVTGDNIRTAQSIARQIGIISKNSGSNRVMEGIKFMKEIGGIVCRNCKTQICNCQRDPQKAKKNQKSIRIDAINDIQRFKDITDNLDVLARSRPEDKYALVLGLKELGNVVAVTGDGTNDAPALKKADVGFAMGISGTEVAREASAIILLDDNFNSIVKSVLWGRNIFDSIKKFVQFQLTINIVAVGITIIGALVVQFQVIKAIQMLWINLIMDTLASLALATQPPNITLLNRKPHSRTESILSPIMKKHILVQSIYQLTVLIIFIFAGQYLIPQYIDSLDSTPGFTPDLKYRDGVVGGYVRSGRMYHPNGSTDYFELFIHNKIYSRHFTFIFNAFVLMQVFNFINARKLFEQINVFEGILNNGLFIGVIIFIVGIQIIIVTFGKQTFGLYPNGLTIQQWLICILIGFISLIVSFLAKMNVIFLKKTQQNRQPQQNLQFQNIPISSVQIMRQQRNNQE